MERGLGVQSPCTELQNDMKPGLNQDRVPHPPEVQNNPFAGNASPTSAVGASGIPGTLLGARFPQRPGETWGWVRSNLPPLTAWGISSCGISKAAEDPTYLVPEFTTG